MKRSSHLLKIAAALGAAFIALPILATLMRVSWSSFISDCFDARHALWLTFLASVASTFFALLFGVPLAWYLSHGHPRITSHLRPLVLSPLVLPPTVIGLALLHAYGRSGLLGSPLYQATGWSMPFTIWAVICVGAYVGIPYIALVVENGLNSVARDIEESAEIEGAGTSQILRLITLPITRNNIRTGVLLAWARASGEFGATIMFAGSLPGVTQTMTTLIYQELDVNPKAANSFSALMLIIGIAIVFSQRKRIRSALFN